MMKIFFFAIGGGFALMLLSFGCARPDAILVDKNFTEEEKNLIADCLKEWNIATDGGYSIDLIFGWDRPGALSMEDFNSAHDMGTMFIVEQEDSIYQEIGDEFGEHEFGGYTVHGEGSDYSWSIIIVRTESQETFRKRVLHELGHYVMGIEHTESGLMMGENTVEDCIDSVSLEAMCEKIQCGPNTKPTCDE